MLNVHLIAAKIYVKLSTDTKFEDTCIGASEFYRTAITESGEADMVVDGSAEYCKLVDVLESLVCRD